MIATAAGIELGPSNGSAVPVVAVHDPVLDGQWTYEIEERIIVEGGARLIVPADDDEARDAIVDADVIIVTGIRPLTAADIATLRRASGILCASVGMNQVDGAAAAAAGIPVRNVPGYCTDEVADHAVTLLLAAWRRLIPLSGRAGAATWATTDDRDVRSIRRLRGSTLGIVGAGRIGRSVAERARAFGMRTLAADPYAPDDDPRLPIVAFDELLAASDGIVICAKLEEASRGLFGADAFARMRSHAVLVNVARGGFVDEPALARALRDGTIAGAALDVRDPEPPAAGDDPLAGAPHLLLTPHIAASSQEAVRDLHEMAARISLEMLRDAGRLRADEASAATSA